MIYKLGVGIFSRLFKREKMNTEELKEKKRIEAHQFPMMVYPKKQKWDGKDFKKLEYKRVNSVEESAAIKDEVFIDWKDLLKKAAPKKKAEAKAKKTGK